MINPGDLVAELFASAEREVIIVAPFIRSAALARLLEAVPEGVRTKIVTRWRPLDILAGASDLGVLRYRGGSGHPATASLRSPCEAVRRRRALPSWFRQRDCCCARLERAAKPRAPSRQ